MRAVMLSLFFVAGWAPAFALEFDFKPQPGMPQEVIAGFVQAGELWEARFDDDITVRLTIAWEKLSPQVLGSTRSNEKAVSYTEFVKALGTQVPLSVDDTSAIRSLDPIPAFQMLLNRTADHPIMAGSAQTYLDNTKSSNNVTVRLTRANAKSLGLLPADATDSDASITFSSEFNWDFDQSDGIDANHFNFVFVAAHEIGHMLGFKSGVDILDINSPPLRGPYSSDQFTFVSSADIFRFSTNSVAEGAGTIDWAADNRPKFFAIDGGTIVLGEYSRGKNFGDGRQASHWRDNQGLGLMDPTVAPGEQSQITNLDEQLFDVIGYERGVERDDTDPSGNADLRITSDRAIRVSFAVVVANDGPNEVTGATVENQLPGLIGDISWTCDASVGATCTAEGVGQINDIVDLPAGSSVTYTVSAAVSGGENFVSVAPPTGINDPVPDNNSNTEGAN